MLYQMFEMTHAAVAPLRLAADTGRSLLRNEFNPMAWTMAGRRMAAALDVPEPAAGTFLFVDLASRLGGRPLLEFLERCADAGLLLAPGTSFGAYPTHVRLCFTAEPPDATARATDLLRDLLGE